MAIKHKPIFEHENAWSDADQLTLCLNTGSWRTVRPVLDISKCNYCGLCSMYCPPQCMIDLDDHFKPNLEFCKGCGICAKECVQGALTMVPEKGVCR